jgi:hypothetical protein
MIRIIERPVSRFIFLYNPVLRNYCITDRDSWELVDGCQHNVDIYSTILWHQDTMYFDLDLDEIMMHVVADVI